MSAVRQSGALPSYEVVANVSEGRDEAVLAAFTAVVAGSPGVQLLDVHRDPDHDRSVYTYVGEADALVLATRALARIAIATIDLTAAAKSGARRGVHPRIGAIDVIPLIPLGPGGSEHGAVVAARALGRTLAADLNLPVHFYGAVARNEARRALPEIRRGGFEALAERQRDPDGEPDEGPIAPHPTGGAVAVGVRPLMAAWNIQLTGAAEEKLVTAARAIARSMRESAPRGIPGLQALGFRLPSVKSAQLSMNLHNVVASSSAGITLHSIRTRAEEEAHLLGVQIGDSEIVGLVPESALRAGGDPNALKVRGGWQRASIESRFAR